MGKFDGKVALVVGANSGMGNAIAERFGQLGAKVVMVGRREALGMEHQEKFRSMGLDATFVRGDIGDPDSVKNFVDKTIELGGKIDMVVNTAGVYSRGTALTHTVEDWDFVVNINMRGSFLLAKNVLPYMIEKQNGVFCFISSNCGHFVGVDQIAYNASKAGEEMFCKTLAREFAKYNIRSNVIAPGGVVTAMSAQSMQTETPEMIEIQRNVKEFQKELIPLTGAPTNTAMIANFAEFMCSDEASYMTGEIINVDGGMTLGFDAMYPTRVTLIPNEK